MPQGLNARRVRYLSIEACVPKYSALSNISWNLFAVYINAMRPAYGHIYSFWPAWASRMHRHRSNSSLHDARETYLRFMLLSILEFWNTVHDFPSIIYHSLESLPSESCFQEHEERTGLSVLNSSIQEREKGDNTTVYGN